MKSAAALKTLPATSPANGATLIWESLVELGVEVVFGYPGGQIMPAYNSLYDFTDRIRHVLVRHEQGAAHAAEGYARASGRTGVCIATSGPGATNLVTGIADAMLDSIPIVCITGQVPSHLLGTDAFQETDIIGITMPITKWSYQVTKASEIKPVLAKAFAIAASGRPGPVLVDITKNAQLEAAPEKEEPLSSWVPYHSVPLPEKSSIEEAARLINEAQKPLLVAGHGVLISGAEKELMEFAEKTEIPVTTTLLGLSAFPTAHPLYTGMAGMHGSYGPNVLSGEADVVIAIGIRFDDRLTGDAKRFIKNARLIHIDIDQAEINKIVPSAVSIVADAKEALKMLIPAVSPAKHEKWLARFREYDQMEHKQVVSRDLKPGTPKLHMAEVVWALSEKTEGEAIVVTDVGQHQMASARYFRFKHPNSFISSGGLGTMGFALPAAMGAAITGTKRPILCIAGDGGIQMTIQELSTIAQENLPVKVVVLNNGYLGMVRQWQELFFERRYSFVELKNPDFVKIAEAMGLKALRVQKREELDSSIDTLLSTPGPVFMEVVVEMETNIFPMVPAGAAASDMRLS